MVKTLPARVQWKSFLGMLRKVRSADVSGASLTLFNPVSYDINKDGYRIATLTLVKSAYRLGDTVNAMISLNGGAARVLRVSPLSDSMD